MNLNLSVQYPTLILGQQLKVEYSTDGVSYTLDSYQSSNTFTTTYAGFAAGTLYYFRFTLVQGSPLIECDSIIQTYRVPNETDCLDFEAEIVFDGLIYRLNITYSIPSPFVQSCGGYVLKYGISSANTVINYPTLPPSISIIVNAAAYYVEMYQVDCEGNLQLCYQELIEPPENDCIPAAFVEKYLTFVGGVWYLNFLISQSNPISPTFILNYAQSNALSSGLPDTGVVPLTASGASPQLFIIPVNPNMNLIGNVITYTGSIVDHCNNSLSFDISKIM